MTAYLQPGDNIHIAFPITILSAWDQDDVNANVRKLGQELTTIYNQMGVGVVGFTSSPSLSHPVVVAVVRDPNVRTSRLAGPPMAAEEDFPLEDLQAR